MTEEHKMRREQYVTALALASKAFTAGDYKESRYWLDGAHLLLTLASQQPTEQRASA